MGFIPDCCGKGCGGIAVKSEKFTLRLREWNQKVFRRTGIFSILIGSVCCCISFFIMLIYLIVGEGIWTIATISTILNAFLTGLGVVLLKDYPNQQVEVDGSSLHIRTKWGRTQTFSVQDIASMSKAEGFLILYDREGKELGKMSLALEGISMLEQYLKEVCGE